MGPSSEAVKGNGVAVRKETCSIESGTEGILTYKRRKSAKALESRKTSQYSLGQTGEKNYARKQAQFFPNGSHPQIVLTNDCSLIPQRNVILEQICQSLGTEHGLRKCIQSILAFHPGSGSGTRVEESLHYSEDSSKCTSQAGTLHGLQMADGGYVGTKSNESGTEPKHSTFTELCTRTLSDIIMSETFAQLCNLLLENFQGLKADKVLNLSRISSRMEENAYEGSAMLFQSDIQEIWAKLQKVGSDITALAKCLSDKTTSSFHEQFRSQEAITTTKIEQMNACASDGAYSCKQCGQEVGGRNGLICDSCEGMYHISCIDPPVKEIPARNWYCADCTPQENKSSHEFCVACERLIATKSSQCDGSFHKFNILHGGTSEKLYESSDGFFPIKGSRRYTKCKVCMNEIRNEDDYKICGHSLCPNTFYHVRCLTGQQLVSYGLCWYCPSCLCRACLTDRDDDKIVLCDGCDHAYHIYCMDPPRDSVPKGKWFCGNCESGMARIREAQLAYKIKQRKMGLDGKLKGKEALYKSGGVDMLLNAAKTLNHEEKLASQGLKIGPA